MRGAEMHAGDAATTDASSWTSPYDLARALRMFGGELDIDELRPVVGTPCPPAVSAQPPTIALVVPTFRRPLALEAMLRSALAQTMPATEIVVCDDASGDETAAVVESFGPAVALVRHEVNRGVAGARNSAAQAASSDYLALVDDDDLLAPQAIEACVRAAALRPDVAVWCTDGILEFDGVVLRTLLAEWPFVVHDQVRAIVERNFVSGLVVVRRADWVRVNGLDERACPVEDWDVCARLVLGGAIVGLIPAPLYHYRWHADGLSRARPRASARAKARLTRRLWRTYRRAGYRRLIGTRLLVEHAKVVRSQLPGR